MAGKQCAIIRDGYNFDGDIVADVDGEYPAINFKFRPLTSLERAVFTDDESKAGENKKAIKESMARVQAEIIAKHITEWDAEEITADGKYQKAEITAGNALLLPSRAFNQLLFIATGLIDRTEKLRKKTREKAKKEAKEAEAEAEAKKTELEESEKN